ncbi:hypothetical protein CRUP_028693 [Coryphaenoides rupestris]|nr:hypothetical protein CRUP_028693 [Coryphaenoides rupestris]
MDVRGYPILYALCRLLILSSFVSADEEAAGGGHGGKEQECHKYAGGHVYPGEASRVPVSDHSLHLSKAKISKPSPHWEGTAVINGEFKELKLTDYRGKYLGSCSYRRQGGAATDHMKRPAVGRSVDETLRLVQPSRWKPGSDTIIPDPSGKLKYFDKLN